MTANGSGQSENKHWKEQAQSHLRLYRGDIQKHSWHLPVCPHLLRYPNAICTPEDLLFLPQMSWVWVLVGHRRSAPPSPALFSL